MDNTCKRCLAVIKDISGYSGLKATIQDYMIVRDGVCHVRFVSNMLMWAFEGSCIKEQNLQTKGQLDLLELKKRCLMLKQGYQNNNQRKNNSTNCQEIEEFLEALAEIRDGLPYDLMSTNDTFHLIKCCEKWLSPEDLSHLQKQDDALYKTMETALLAKRRQKRETYQWTCSQIRSLPMMFLTATVDEIAAMDDAEFIDCLPDIGQLSDLKEQQKEAILSKAKSALSKTSVCEMDTSDLVNLGVVSLVFTVEDINCLPLNEISLISSLGSIDGWSPSQLNALASRFLSTNSLTDLSSFTSTEITMLGPVMCGFTSNLIATIPSVEIGKSGIQVGELSECSTALLTEFVKLASQEDAYGSVGTWGAAEVTELKYLIAGLSDTEIKQLTVAAIEGLDSDVIPVIPVNVLKEMTEDQLMSFTDAQAVAVTDAQRAVMSSEQKKIIGEQSTGGEQIIEEVVINSDDGDDDEDDGDKTSSSGSHIKLSITGLGLLMILVPQIFVDLVV